LGIEPVADVGVDVGERDVAVLADDIVAGIGRPGALWAAAIGGSNSP